MTKYSRKQSAAVLTRRPSLVKSIDRHFGFEQHFIRGLAKMTTRVALAIAVMMAMALGHIRQGRPEQMRSLVQPIPATG